MAGSWTAASSLQRAMSGLSGPTLDGCHPLPGQECKKQPIEAIRKHRSSLLKGQCLHSASPPCVQPHYSHQGDNRARR